MNALFHNIMKWQELNSDFEHAFVLCDLHHIKFADNTQSSNPPKWEMRDYIRTVWWNCKRVELMSMKIKCMYVTHKSNRCEETLYAMSYYKSFYWTETTQRADIQFFCFINRSHKIYCKSWREAECRMHAILFSQLWAIFVNRYRMIWNSFYFSAYCSLYTVSSAQGNAQPNCFWADANLTSGIKSQL